jgi:hypothetical protein
MTFEKIWLVCGWKITKTLDNATNKLFSCVIVNLIRPTLVQSKDDLIVLFCIIVVVNHKSYNELLTHPHTLKQQKIMKL